MEDRPQKTFLSTPESIIFGAIIIAVAVLVSGGVIKIKGFNSNKVLGTKTNSDLQQQSPEPSKAPSSAKISLGDAPILGDKNAPVTLVEFSDYECPFCKSYFDQTLPQIKKDYVETGKVKLVFRNLPLSFHANAHKEAEAVLCARDQGGDDIYFKFHDEVFKKTTSNGTGLALTELPKIAQNLGLNVDTFQQCFDSEKYKTKVDQDLSYAESVGANGTPTFFIGKSSADGVIEGSKIVGAVPYASFKSAIDNLL